MSGTDFALALEGSSSLEGPWKYLHVVQFDARDAMSRLFHYEIVTLLKNDDCDPEDFIGKRASLRIATGTLPPYRLVHGIITQAEDAGVDAQGPLYRLTLEPPLARAKHRKRSRIFVDKTFRQIIESVLQNDLGMTLVSGALLDTPMGGPLYQPASERFTWRMGANPRLDDPKARAYVVQYGESDFNFISRLLEEEGIGYHFEHDDDTSLLVLSDRDFGRPRVALDDIFSPGKLGHSIDRFRVGGRLRAQSVHLGEYNWEKPKLDIDAHAKGKGTEELSVYSFPGSYVDNVELGNPLARARFEALKTEASFATGAGTTRLLAPGMIFTLEYPRVRNDGEYLVTQTHARGYQQGVLSSEGPQAPKEPYRVDIECACRGRGTNVAESQYRPQRSTSKPRIHGTQTAFVTAEPGGAGEINLGGPSNIGCVRVAFHWDKDKNRRAKEPSSKWIRVSEPFARGGQGGIWHPRVGCEVIVEFEEGDPDRPVITGRVYNGKNRPAQTAPTHSTLWSLSTPGGAVRNEITFEDTAGSERIYTNAGKDMTTNVGNDRRETVGANAFMHVGANNTEIVGQNQTITIGANDSLEVGGNQTEIIGSNQLRLIGANRIMVTGGNETRTTGANHANIVGSAVGEVVGSNVVETYGASRKTDIGSNWTENYDANRTQTVGALTFQSYGANQTTIVGGSRNVKVGAMLGQFVSGTVETDISGNDTLSAGAAVIHIAGGGHNHTAASLTINASLKLHLIGLSLSTYPTKLSFTGFSLSLAGVSIGIKDFSISHTSMSLSATGFENSIPGVKLLDAGSRLHAVGVLIYPAGMHVIT